MRFTIDLPHLKLGKTGNAKYRRFVTSFQMRAKISMSAVEWSLRTHDPVLIVERWKEADAKFEAMQSEAEGKSTAQSEWDLALAAAVEHGLARTDSTKIGPVDAEMERGKFEAFTDAILAEMGELTPQQREAKFANNPPTNPALQLVRAKFQGLERPPVTLNEAVSEADRIRARLDKMSPEARADKLSHMLEQAHKGDGRMTWVLSSENLRSLIFPGCYAPACHGGKRLDNVYYKADPKDEDCGRQIKLQSLRPDHVQRFLTHAGHAAPSIPADRIIPITVN